MPINGAMSDTPTAHHGQLKDDEFSDTLENRSAIADRLCNRGKIVIEDNDVARLLGDFRARSHGEADIRLFERGRVVDSVPRHARNQPPGLRQTDEAALIRRQRPRHHAKPRQQLQNLFVRHRRQFFPRNHQRGVIPIRRKIQAILFYAIPHGIFFKISPTIFRIYSRRLSPAIFPAHFRKFSSIISHARFHIIPHTVFRMFFHSVFPVESVPSPVREMRKSLIFCRGREISQRL